MDSAISDPGDVWTFFHTAVIVRLVMGSLCFGSVLSSSLLIRRHLLVDHTHGANIYITRIILMVPIFSVQSLVALWFTAQQLELNKVLELCRKGYECIVIFAFLQLLVCALGGIERVATLMNEEDCAHLPPVKWVLGSFSWAPPRLFLWKCLSSVLQYVPVSLIAATIGVASWPLHQVLAYGPYNVFYVVQGICTGAILASQALAMYGLVLFYHGNQARLSHVKPIMKLVSIKLLVIVTMWQQYIFTFLDKQLHVFDEFAKHSVSVPPWTSEQISDGVINAMLIVEMFLLSVWHHSVYPPGEITFEAPGTWSARRRTCLSARRFLKSWSLGDVLSFHRDLKKMASNVEPTSMDGEEVSRGHSCHSTVFHTASGTSLPLVDEAA